MKMFFAFVFLASTLNAMTIETVGGPHATIIESQGVKMTNITPIFPAYDAITTRGLHNGYSRYSCASPDGRSFIAYATNSTESALYRDGVFVRKIKHPLSNSSANGVGEYHDLRWRSNTEFVYNWGPSIFRQDAMTGTASAIVTFPAGIKPENHQGDHPQWRTAKVSGKLYLVDVITRTSYDTGLAAPFESDVSPSGEWLLIDVSAYDALPPRFYRLAAIVAGDKTQFIDLPSYRVGHDGWATDPQGNECYLWQDNGTDFFCAFVLKSKAVHKLIGMAETGYSMGVHFCRTVEPRGWALMSTYATTDNSWAYNQLLAFEIGTGRMLRLGHTGNRFYTGAYFTQCFMGYGASYLWWGSNARGTDNLEVYRMPWPDLSEPEPRIHVIKIKADDTTQTWILEVGPKGN